MINLHLVPPSVDTEALGRYVARMCRQPDVKRAVEENHDRNRWWPPDVADWRLRMLVAGWSTRISNHMVSSYARVVTQAVDIGYDQLVDLPSDRLQQLIAPLGLPGARRRYLYSLHEYLQKLDALSCDPRSMEIDHFISDFAQNVDQASYKVAQCATLYARGYHCGVIPVDTGMVTKLAPRLGLRLSRSAVAHEEMRRYLEADLRQNATAYLQLLSEAGYRVTVPDRTAPSWWLHLVLIYSKRLYCNRPSSRLCRRVPSCNQVLDCSCKQEGA